MRAHPKNVVGRARIDHQEPANSAGLLGNDLCYGHEAENEAGEG